jgi:hypothetical protein
MTLRSLLCLIACLTAAPIAAHAQAPALQASAWTDYAKPKPIPIYGGQDCKPADPSGCAEAWRKLLAIFGQEALDAPTGGRTYRAMIGHGPADPNLYLLRLDIAADGRATVTTSFKGQPGQGASFSNAKVEAFDAALAASTFDKSAPSTALAVCKDGQSPVIFEALVEDRYKVVVDGCGLEPGLARALAALTGG